MNLFKCKPLCEKRGYHQWNEVAGYADGTCGPIDSSACLDCDVRYKAPPYVVPLHDRLEALKHLIVDREKLEERIKRYPQEMIVGKYRCVMDYKTGPDHYINKLWSEL